MRKKGAFVAALILLAVAWYVFAGHVSTDDAQVDCHITAVAPQVPGYVVQLFINDNTPVKEGDLLVQIDARPYQAEVEQAKANLDFAEAQANSAKLQITLTRETTTHNTGGATAQKESDAADYASSQAQLEQSATANLQVAEANVAAKKATNDRAQSDLARYTPCSPRTMSRNSNLTLLTLPRAWQKAICWQPNSSFPQHDRQ